MIWLLLTLGAVAIWSITSISDKFVLDKLIKEPLVPTTIYAGLGIIFTIVIVLFQGINHISSVNIVLAIISGGFYLLMAIYYFKAVCVEEISRVNPLFYLSNVLITIFATIFLGEVLSISKYAAIIMLIIGAILISVKELKSPRLDLGTFYMILAAIFTAANMLINKIVLNTTDFWTVFAWNRVGSFLFMIPIFYIYRKQIKLAFKKMSKKAYVIVNINEVLNLSGVILITLAISLGFVSVVTGISAIQPLFIFILTIILSVFFPRFIKENISKHILAQKLTAIILIVAGAILLI
jgi:uncharacterized membrane protein